MFSTLLRKITILFVGCLLISCQSKMDNEYEVLIENGEFSKATQMIQDKLENETNLSDELKNQLAFEIERMKRIKKDFTKSETDVFEYIKEYIPDVSKSDLEKWEKSRALEVMLIDGEKKYFNRAARNLFRIDKECLRIWNEHHYKNPDGPEPSIGKIQLDKLNRKMMKAAQTSEDRYLLPARFRIKYSISVDENAVPNGETVRCWIPFPREIKERQTDIKLLKTEPIDYKLADVDKLQRTIYFEKSAIKDEKTKFLVEYEFTNRGAYVKIDPEKVKPVKVNSELSQFLKEVPPHIVFTDELKELSKKIVGEETNPYLISKKLFKWMDANNPWASAREYSTIRNIPGYCIKNMHGDCGIHALTYITLCRINGIPARWQSGWEFQPPEHDSMHDWGMIYYEPYGWMPMDVDYGLSKTDDEEFKWFYISGMDSYRLIFNDDISQPFWPEKKHIRSETIDSQRGEVEWEGGNLYFDQWDWDIEWELIEN
jgi:transglutaminase-like putative cysteine protease